MNENTNDCVYCVADSYLNRATKEALAFSVSMTIHYENGATRTLASAARDCRRQVNREFYATDVKYITIGSCRNYVVVFRGGASSVIFYDCFFLPPEDRDMQIEKEAYDYVCAEYLPIADTVARDYEEYIQLLNTDVIKRAFDARNKECEKYSNGLLQ